MTRRIAWLAVAVGLLVVLGFWQQHRIRQLQSSLALRGETMGTTYSVRAAGPIPLPAERLQALIDERLRLVNASMSTWDPQSELSRLNAAPAGTPLPLSEDLATVLAAALELSRATDGAFDPTVGPLVNLWGFGPERHAEAPSAEEIAAARRRTGYRHLRLQGSTLTRALPGLELDLSAIAKGFGVDAVARVLEAQGIANYLVEIGGDLVAKGHNPQGQPWRIGIEKPVEGAPQGEFLQAVVGLSAGGMATSGSYRRFRRSREGQAHHIIDPRTGRPTQPGLVSVTVVAPDCMTADGIATALMVMGVREGLAWVERQPGVEAYFLEAGAQGAEGADAPLTQHTSSGFPPLQPPR